MWGVLGGGGGGVRGVGGVGGVGGVRTKCWTRVVAELAGECTSIVDKAGARVEYCQILFANFSPGKKRFQVETFNPSIITKLQHQYPRQ